MSRSGLFFENFPPADTAAWIREIEKELKGRISIDSLTWIPEPGLSVRPFYRREDVPAETYPVPRAQPGWRICDRLDLSQGIKLADEIRTAETNGADAVELILPDEPYDGEIDLSVLDGCALPVLLFGDFKSLQSHAGLWLDSNSMPSVSFLFDPVSDAFMDSRDDPSRILVSICDFLSSAGDSRSRLRVGCADERRFIRAGTDLIKSSACLLSVLACWIRSLGALGIEAAKVTAELTIIVSTGTRFIPEIARLRAIRLLAPQVVAAMGAKDCESISPEIHALTSDSSLPSYDIHTNLVRTTTQALAAVLGGCDSLSVHPYDSVSGDGGSVQARNWARNIQLILRDESYLGIVEDPLAGSYYLEHLTDQMMELIWLRFLEIEDAGGWIEALGKGIPQQWAGEDRRRIQEETESGDRKIVGVTAYPDINDDAWKRFTASHVDAFSSFDRIESLRSDIRGSLARGEPVTTLHLIGAGLPGEQNLGISFAANFISCGGFPLSRSEPAKNREKALEDCLEAEPTAVVVCGSLVDWQSKLADFEKVYLSSGGKAFALYASFENLTSHDDDVGSDRLIHAGSHLLNTLNGVRDLGAGRLMDPDEVNL